MSGMSGAIPSSPIGMTCERLVITTVLLNPDMNILPTLSVGDKLDIEIDPNVGVVANAAGQCVGSIVVEPTTMDKLIECMDGGTIYKGTIIELDPTVGLCRIRITVV